VDALAEKLDARLREWRPETAAEARERIAEVIELADHDILDIARSRAAEQEVLDLLDEPPTRRDLAGGFGTRRQDASRCHRFPRRPRPATRSRLVRASHHPAEK
jgi:hypothetical protein